MLFIAGNARVTYSGSEHYGLTVHMFGPRESGGLMGVGMQVHVMQFELLLNYTKIVNFACESRTFETPCTESVKLASSVRCHH